MGGRAFPLNFHFVFVLLSIVCVFSWIHSLTIPKQLDFPLYPTRSTGNNREHTDDEEDLACTEYDESEPLHEET